MQLLLLNATLLNGTDVVSAQDEILGLNDSSTITADLELAIEYADKIAMTTREINQTFRHLMRSILNPDQETILSVIRMHYQPAGTSMALTREDSLIQKPISWVLSLQTSWQRITRLPMIIIQVRFRMYCGLWKHCVMKDLWKLRSIHFLE